MNTAIDSALLKSKIRAEMNLVSDHILTGPINDWSEYQRQRGVVEGYALAERLLLDMVVAANKAEGIEDE